jgi:hypothetical protein
VKTFKIFLLGLVALAMLAAPGAALAAPFVEPDPDDIIIFGDNYTLAAGQIADSSLVVFGGNVIVEAGASVANDLLVIGGNVEMDGSVGGNVVVIGGNLDLGPTAVVEGDLITPSGNVLRDPAAIVRGNQVTEVNMGEFRNMRTHWGDRWLGSVWAGLQTLGLLAAALLLVLFVPANLRRTADTIVARPAVSGGVGLLTLIVLPFALLITLITCIVPGLLLLVVILACVYGWVALGLVLGNRLAEAFKQEWSPLATALLGTLALSVLTAVLGWIPCVGWLAGIAAGSVGLGATILSRFGTEEEPLVVTATLTRPALPAPRKTTRKSTTKKTTRK